jgi:hypothetical protein
MLCCEKRNGAVPKTDPANRFARILILALLIFVPCLAAVAADPIDTEASTTPSAASEGQTQASATMPPASTISVQVKVVNVLATVRDKHGRIISNLGKDDFTLTEDSRPQSIQYFTRETDIPLTLGLLVDTSLNQRRVLDQERSASHSFLDHMVREDKDKAFVIHFDREVELLQDLTPSHQKLESALEDLETPASNAPVQATRRIPILDPRVGQEDTAAEAGLYFMTRCILPPMN